MVFILTIHVAKRAKHKFLGNEIQLLLTSLAFISSLNKYVLSTHTAPGLSVPVTGDIKVQTTNKKIKQRVVPVSF